MRKKDYRTIYGNQVTHEEIAAAAEIGISFKTLSQRLKYGWTVEDALTRPVDGRKGKKSGSREKYIDKMELKGIIGRIKYLNAHAPDFPYTIPKPLLTKAKRLGINFEEIEPIKVEEASH